MLAGEVKLLTGNFQHRQKKTTITPPPMVSTEFYRPEICTPGSRVVFASPKRIPMRTIDFDVKRDENRGSPSRPFRLTLSEHSSIQEVSVC
nr:hypothetical protein Iba_chr02dCG2250 [Ipomoea batatas]